MLIVALLTAVLYPSAMNQIRRGQSSALANELENMRTAILNYQKNVQHWPASLSQLTTAPGAGSTDLCGVTLPGLNQGLWRGPYLTQVVSGAVPIGDASIQNLLGRNPPASAAPGVLQILVNSVDTLNAADLERQFDGTTINYASGTILYNNITDILTFQIAIRGC